MPTMTEADMDAGFYKHVSQWYSKKFGTRVVVGRRDTLIGHQVYETPEDTRQLIEWLNREGERLAKR